MADEKFTQAQVDEAVDKARADLQTQLDTAKGELLNAQGKITQLETSLSEKGTQIQTVSAERDSLATEVTSLTTERDTLKAETDPLKTGLGTALAEYKKLAIQANPDVPEELIRGATIEDLSASVEAGRSLVAKVRESISKQLSTTQVPPGAPPRTPGPPDLDNMTPIDKIKYGIANPPKS